MNVESRCEEISIQSAESSDSIPLLWVSQNKYLTNFVESFQIENQE